MKALTTILTVLLACTIVFACTTMQQNLSSSATGPVLGRIQQTGQLRVGCTGDMPPLNMTTSDGELIGMEIELAELIADAMGVKPEFVTMPFADLLPALRSGRIDVIISGMTITAQRNLAVAFVGPYYRSGKAFLTKFKTVAAVKDPSELNSPKTRLAALKGSTSQEFVQTFIPEALLFATADYQEAVQMVIDGKVDAMLADYPICVVSLFRYPDAGLISLISRLTYEPIGIAVPATDPLLVNWLQNYLNYLEETGVIDRMQERWFAHGSWLERLP
jgi:polar amino acid transport system substrate-binding protein